jgi:hypothetical protein
MLEWGQGNEDKYQLAEVLRAARLESALVIYIDSIVTTTMFGRYSKHALRKRFHIQVLLENAVESLNGNIQWEMEDLYEAYKK